MLLREIKYIPNRIKNGILNLIDWAPIIWKDRDYDHSFLFDIMIKKMNRMEKFFKSENCWSVDGIKNAKQICEAIVMLEYIRDEKFEEEAFKEYHDKYSMSHLTFEEMIDTIQQEDADRTAVFRKSMKKQEELYNTAADALFKNLKENMLSWWD